jgi:phosphinothricin acetyltransferase
MCENIYINKIEFRYATMADTSGIQSIYNYYIAETEVSWRYQVLDESYYIRMIREHPGGRRPSLVAICGGQIVGFCLLSDFRQGEGYWPCAEISIYVDKEFTGRGIGHELMNRIIELGREAGLRAIIAGIDGDNQASIRFHEAFGFVSNGLLKDIGWKNNRWRSLVLMQLTLSEA